LIGRGLLIAPLSTYGKCVYTDGVGR